MQQAQHSMAVRDRDSKGTSCPSCEQVTHVFISKQWKRLYVYSVVTQIGEALQKAYSAARAKSIIPREEQDLHAADLVRQIATISRMSVRNTIPPQAVWSWRTVNLVVRGVARYAPVGRPPKST